MRDVVEQYEKDEFLHLLLITLRMCGDIFVLNISIASVLNSPRHRCIIVM